KTAARRSFLALEPRNTEQSSLIRCMGTAISPSPTLVFGKVYRSYILERGIRRKPPAPAGPEVPASAAALPFIPQDRFNDPQWPGTAEEAQQILKPACDNDWSSYGQCMSTLIVAPCNEGLAYAFDTGGQNPRNRSLKPTFQTSELTKLGRSLKYSPQNPKDLILDGPIELYRGSQQVYAGEVQQALANLGPLSLARCGREVNSTKDLLALFQELKRKGISTTGYYHVKGPFTWTADFNTLALGGVGIVADGDLRVSESIMPSTPATDPDLQVHPIVLVSLKGNLIIGTNQPLHASLCAPLGELRLEGSRGLSLSGTLAVWKLNADVLNSAAEKTIRYDPLYDWADQNAHVKTSRVMLEHQPLVFQAKLE
ncbi:MAG TPA: hypothetical protein PKO06_18235, partial [Candidatus Ozemobacteraceae bacterium]|nr:hypothetical protein [Candidatus Ozemobacteraceae bacterium]